MMLPINFFLSKEPRLCCFAALASCFACAAGITEEEYCKLHPETVGCAPGILLSIFKNDKMSLIFHNFYYFLMKFIISAQLKSKT